MSSFNYTAPAELFSNGAHSKRRSFPGFRSFSTGSEALRFSVEEISTAALAGVILESDGERYGPESILELYNNADYPLIRRQSALRDHARAVERLARRNFRRDHPDRNWDLIATRWSDGFQVGRAHASAAERATYRAQADEELRRAAGD